MERLGTWGERMCCLLSCWQAQNLPQEWAMSQCWKEAVEASSAAGEARPVLVGDSFVFLFQCSSGMTEKKRSGHVYYDFDSFKLERLYPLRTEWVFTTLQFTLWIWSFGKSLLPPSQAFTAPVTCSPRAPHPHRGLLPSRPQQCRSLAQRLCTLLVPALVRGAGHSPDSLPPPGKVLFTISLRLVSPWGCICLGDRPVLKLILLQDGVHRTVACLEILPRGPLRTNSKALLLPFLLTAGLTISQLTTLTL